MGVEAPQAAQAGHLQSWQAARQTVAIGAARQTVPAIARNAAAPRPFQSAEERVAQRWVHTLAEVLKYHLQMKAWYPQLLGLRQQQQRQEELQPG